MPRRCFFAWDYSRRVIVIQRYVIPRICHSKFCPSRHCPSKICNFVPSGQCLSRICISRHWHSSISRSTFCPLMQCPLRICRSRFFFVDAISFEDLSLKIFFHGGIVFRRFVVMYCTVLGIVGHVCVPHLIMQSAVTMSQCHRQAIYYKITVLLCNLLVPND